MLDEEIIKAATDLESHRVERKRALTDVDRIREAICAFSNDLPASNQQGLVLIGIEDDGSCAKTPITDELLLRMAQLRDDGTILPTPSLEVRRVLSEDCEFAAIIVEPTSNTPVRFNGRTWIRIGPRRAIASIDEERRLVERRRNRDLPFDLHPVPHSTIDDLDLEFFRGIYLPSAIAPDVLAENGRSTELQLQALRMLSPDPVTPTALGILVIGKDPLQFFPGAYVQFLRHDGTSVIDPILDEKRLTGRIDHVSTQLDDLVAINIRQAVQFTGISREQRRPDYPFEAIRQIIRNAILHRTYEGTNTPVRFTWFQDRIEIASPGGPFGQVTIEGFGRPNNTDYRNPNLGASLRDLGFVQRFGVGLELAKRALSDNGNPGLEFQVEPTFINVVVKALQ